jgi:DNA polymerase beta
MQTITNTKRLRLIVPRGRRIQPNIPTSFNEQMETNVQDHSRTFLDDKTRQEIETRKSKFATISLKKNTSSNSDYNKLIIEQLQLLVHHIEDQIRSSEKAEDRKKHGFRLSSIKKGIDLIKDYPEKITSGRQVRQIKGIGKGIADRIDEILESEMLSELVEEAGNGDESNRRIKELTSVTGIGVVKARELMAKYELEGVEDLIKRWQSGEIKVEKHGITHQIEIGLRWYYDIQKKIPREEMDEFNAILTDLCKTIDPELSITICGSYRRGKTQSNDIDVLMTHPKLVTEPDVTSSNVKYLPVLLSHMETRGMLADSITDPVKSPTKYMGVANLPGQNVTRRRIDIRFVPFESYASAGFYFTGSGNFNKLFRGIALQRGYTLNEYGIYKLDEKGEKSELIPTFSEQQIFDVVGVEYLTPNEREFT